MTINHRQPRQVRPTRQRPFSQRLGRPFRCGLLLLAISGTAMAADASLRAELPADAVLYMRLPSAQTPLVTGDESALVAVQNNEQIQKAYRSIGQALVKEVRSNEERLGHPIFGLLLADLCGPLELALLPPPAGNQGPPLPNMLVSAPLCLASGQSFTERLNQINDETAAEVFDLSQPLNDQGLALGVLNRQIPIQLQWQGDRQRLLLLTGPSAGAVDMLAFSATLKPAEHALHAVEQRVDAAGHGLLLWIDGQRGLKLVNEMLPPDVKGMLEATGANQAQALALGVGTANGKGRASLLLDMPPVGLRQAIPLIDSKYDLSVAGQPTAVLAIALPSSAQLRTIAAIANGGDSSKYDALSEQFADYTGATLDELLDAIGPEVLLFADDAGEYLALRLRDNRSWQTLLDKATEKMALKRRSFERNGHKYHALHMPNSNAFNFAALGLDPAQLGEPASYLLELLGRINAHNYWTRSGDYVVFGQTPQNLYEFIEHDERGSVGNWARETLRLDPSHALLFAGGEINEAPRRLYALLVDSMTALAEATGADFDPFKLPTAAELELPDSGTFALQLESGSRGLSLESSYDLTPLDFVYGLESVSSLTLLSNLLYSSAYPALMQVIAEQQAALNSGDETPLAELERLAFYARIGVDSLIEEGGQFPDSASSIEDQGLPVSGQFISSITLAPAADSPVAGTLVLTFADAPAVPADYAGSLITWSRDAEGEWVCSSAMLPSADAELPEDCR